MPDAVPPLQARLFEAATELHGKLVLAFANYAGQACGLGFRDEAIETMAHAVALLERMDRDGRGDSAAELMRVASGLNDDDLREPVFRRAAELAEAF